MSTAKRKAAPKKSIKPKGARAAAAPKLVFRAVTAARWKDFEALFQSKGAPSYCWCMAFRATKDERDGGKVDDKAGRKRAMQARVKKRTAIGILGYADGAPVAWCSVAPRSTFASYLPEGVGGDDVGVWSISCMFVPRAMRGQGLTQQLIAAAVAHAKKKGARVVEGTPVGPSSPSYRYMGRKSSFVAAGFERVCKVGSRRELVQLRVKRGSKPG